MVKKSKSKVAVVVSEFNDEITCKLLSGAVSCLMDGGVLEKNIKVVKVPGAVEIPLVAKLLARSKKYKAILCLGAVIRGDTDHYDYVCQMVSNGCMQVMLETEVPVLFGVLTTQTVKLAKDRVGGKSGHKGMETASAALAMMELMESL